jgi:CHASE3 domain sensor protein
MALSIFWRIMLGYFTISILSIGLSSYSIVQLGRLSDTARTAQNVDNRMIAYEEKLVDALLSEVRYGKKYIITQANTLHDQSREFNRDFVNYLSGLTDLAESPDIKVRLARVREFHLRYASLFDQEVRYLKTRQTYAESRYREEKEKAVDRILAELEKLKGELQKNVLGKLESIEKAAHLTRRIAFLMTLVFFALSVAVSFVISKSLTKTMPADATDDHSGRDRVSSRFLKIQELVNALKNMKRKFYDGARPSWNMVASSWYTMKVSVYAMRYGKEKKW